MVLFWIDPPVPRRRPWKLAQELTTLDHLSNGRMILGVGLGDNGQAEGVTWWHEYIPPTVGGFEVQRKLIERGPLRIE